MIVEPTDADLGTRRDRDRALVEAHCAGDPHAFATIVSDHYRVLLAQAERRLGNRSDAEDAVQEAFERAFRAVCRFGSTGEFRLGAWLSRILSNVCNDHGGRAAAERGLTGRVAAYEVDDDDAFERVSDPVVLRAVHDAIDALPSSQRDTFVLKEVDGLSYPQVADALEISEDNARARVHRAKAALQRSLALTRAALGAVIAIPVGLRTALRRGRDLSPAVPSGAEAGTGAAQSLALQVAASPVGQAVAAIAPSGAVRGSAIAALAGLAVTGALAVPAVTGGSAKSTPADRPAAAAQTVAAPTAAEPSAGAPVFEVLGIQTDAPQSSTTTTVPGVPAGGTSSPKEWYDSAAPLLRLPAAGALAEGSPCALPDEELGALGAPGLHLVSKLDLPHRVLTATDSEATSSFELSARFLDPVLAGAPLDIAGQVCFDGMGGASLQVELASAGAAARLAGTLASVSAGESSTAYTFRGRTTGAPASWGLGPEFLAKLDVRTDPDSGEKLAQLSVLFYAFDGTPPGEVNHIVAFPAPEVAPEPEAPAEPPAGDDTSPTEPTLPPATTTTLPPAASGGEGAGT